MPPSPTAGAEALAFVTALMPQEGEDAGALLLGAAGVVVLLLLLCSCRRQSKWGQAAEKRIRKKRGRGGARWEAVGTEDPDPTACTDDALDNVDSWGVEVGALRNGRRPRTKGSQRPKC